MKSQEGIAYCKEGYWHYFINDKIYFSRWDSKNIIKYYYIKIFNDKKVGIQIVKN